MATEPKNDNISVDTLLFADDQAIITSLENDLQKATFKLSIIAQEYNLEISQTKTKVMAQKGKEIQRAKMVLNNTILNQVKEYHKAKGKDIHNKLQTFQYLCGTFKRTLSKKVRKQTILKLYKVLAVPALLSYMAQKPGPWINNQ